MTISLKPVLACVAKDMVYSAELTGPQPPAILYFPGKGRVRVAHRPDRFRSRGDIAWSVRESPRAPWDVSLSKIRIGRYRPKGVPSTTCACKTPKGPSIITHLLPSQGIRVWLGDIPQRCAKRDVPRAFK